MASAAASKQLINPQSKLHSNKSHNISSYQPISSSLSFNGNHNNSHYCPKSCLMFSSRRYSGIAVRVRVRASAEPDNSEDGISLGTMKLPSNTDIPRFETLLFQWANSLSQGAQLPLPMPLKVDKIEGGVRLGFVDIDDGKTDVRVYIDCLVISNTNNSEPPVFVATRNGALKNKVPLGEPRIMKSLLAALKKSIEIAVV